MPAEDPGVLVRLPEGNRSEFKEPLGPITTDAEGLFSRLDGPVLTIGDVVSYHAQEAGRIPDVAVIDGRTKRSAVDPTIETTLAAAPVERIEARNPSGTITESLVAALETALDRDGPVQIVVDGEEDLAAIPAILLAPAGSHVVYGQPGEGIVHVAVTAESRALANELVGYFDGKTDALRSMNPN